MEDLLESNFDKKLAKLAIEYALSVKPGDKIFITGSEIAAPLMRALYSKILKLGGHPYVYVQLSGLDDLLFQHGNEEQLGFMPPVENFLMHEYDGRIYILTDENTRKFEQVSMEKMMAFKSSEERGKTRSIRESRVLKGEFKWVVVPYPCHAYAQGSGMNLIDYSEFAAKALKLYDDDPVKTWVEFGENQQRLVDYMNHIERIHIKSPDTDLSFSVKGRVWDNACGHVNLPDGEIFTGPVENSLNGHIQFSFPGFFQSKEIDQIFLEFEDGEVVRATASKGEDLLQTLLKIEGATRIGEFAFGTNYGISQFTKQMLFDEKIGGTIHLALGNGYSHTGSKNISAVHWDIIKDMRNEEAQIYADDKLIYQAGKWLI